MKFTVEIYEDVDSVSYIETNSKKKAIEYAKRESTDTNRVFIVTSNDSQTVYLNPDGYDVAGKTW